MKDLITKLAEKYSFDTINQRVVALANAPTIRIGFIGEFSAGKTSLINSILGINLPTNIAPTTKAICVIEPTVGIESNIYYREDGNQRSQTDFNTFRSILRGETDCQAAVVQVPPCEVLPTGCVFVDTPGIHTATGSEAELTKAYLSMLDAAVVCINITNGVINKDLLDFLCDAQLRHLQKHLVFALTWSDRKSHDEGEIVRSSIVQLLEKTVREGKMEMTNINDKVFTVSANESGNAAKVYGILKQAVLEDLPALHEQRKQQMLREIGKDLAKLLEESLKIASFDSSELDAELERVQKDIKALQIELGKRESKMESLEVEIQGDIKNVLSNRIYAISTSQSDEERAVMINQMNDDLSNLLHNKAEKYLGISDFTNEGLGDMGAAIEQKLKSIDVYKDLAVTVTTAIATAWIIPGGALAGNLGQAAAGAAASGAASGAASAAAGAAAKGAASAAAKGAASAAAKGAASAAAKGAASAAAKGAASAAATTVATTSTFAGTFTQVLGGIGKALKAINPLEQVGTLIATSVKKNALETLVEEKSSSIASSFISSLETPFQIEVIQPLQDSLDEKRKHISELRQKGDKAFEDFRNKRTQMAKDLEQLRALL